MVLICSRSCLWSGLVKVLTDLFILTLIHALLKSSLTFIFCHALLKSSLTFAYVDTNSRHVKVTVVYFTTDPRVMLC